MKILIEGYKYAPEDVKGILPEGQILLTDEKVKIDYVGYFRNAQCDDFIFFLPKVLLEERVIGGVVEDRVFCAGEDDGFRPEEILDPEVAVRGDGRRLSEGQKNFLYEFAVWIYRAIARYREAHRGSEAVWSKRERQSGAFRRKYVTNTLLDVILALRRFARENEEYFVFKVQEKHTGLNKISWGRTIAKSAAVMEGGRPIYLEVRNKKRVIDFDEELLVIFYSILDYIRVRYGFRQEVGLGYELLSAREFERYLAGAGVRRLRAIRGKYFSDRDVAMWELCFAFFDKAHRANVVSASEEYLLAKDFNIIFEAMIDDLIGDRDAAGLKELKNGQEMDHLYFDESLTRRDGAGANTFYIADSKYYKRGAALEQKSVSKQFTYAREMLQLDLDLFLSEEESAAKDLLRKKGVGKLRDEVTEGYDVIPNFFISATMDEGFNYDAANLEVRKADDGKYRNIHFENRLFDRDTLILSHYDVNFLYVVKLYAQNDAAHQARWRKKVRGEFKEHIRGILEGKFKFYAMMPHRDAGDKVVRDFLRERFDVALGKVYRAYPDSADGRAVYSLAVEDEGACADEGKREKIAAENEAVKKELEKVFYIVEAKLGESPEGALRAKEAAGERTSEGVLTEAALTSRVLYGTYHGKAQLDFMRKSRLYHMALETAAAMGIVTKQDAEKKQVLFAVPPQRGDTEPIVFSILSFRGIVSAAEIREQGWKETSHEKYYLWQIAVAE